MNWWNRPRLSIKDVVLYGGSAALGSFYAQVIAELVRRAYRWLVS